MAKDFGVSQITNTIYYGTANEEKHMFTGNKEDVADGTIRTVPIGFWGIEGSEYKNA